MYCFTTKVQKAQSYTKSNMNYCPVILISHTYNVVYIPYSEHIQNVIFEHAAEESVYTQAQRFPACVYNAVQSSLRQAGSDFSGAFAPFEMTI